MQTGLGYRFPGDTQGQGITNAVFIFWTVKADKVQENTVLIEIELTCLTAFMFPGQTFL